MSWRPVEAITIINMKLALQVCVSVHVCTMFVSSVLGFIASFYEYPVVRPSEQEGIFYSIE